MHFLALQKIARPGDGLAPALLRLLSAREAQASDATIVPIRRFNSAIPDVAAARASPEPQRLAAADQSTRQKMPPT